MLTKKRQTLGVCGLSLLLACSSSVAARAAEAKVGKTAPGFSGTDINGKVHRLSDYKGKIVVLEAINLDCPFSANHYKTGSVQALQAATVSKGVVWLLINSTHAKHASYRTPQAARKEFADNHIRATAWIDDNAGSIGKLYGMQTTPHLFVIDHNGILVYQGAIDDRADSSADPRTARNYVRPVIEALLASKPVTPLETRPYGCSVKYAE